MMTVGAMSKNAYLTFKLSQTNPTFANISNQTSSLFPSTDLFGSASSNNTLLKDALSNQLAQQKDTVAKLDEYNKTSDNFYSGFFPAMDNLKTSAESMKKTDFSSGKTTDIIDSVKNFASDYNGAVNFFNDNAKISTKIASLATSFSAPKYNGNALESIGVNVDSKGRLSIDEAKLSSALTADADKVGELLGQKGLASQALNKVTSSVANSTNLIPFPKISNQAANGLMPGALLDLYA